jgi:hypothetical protein
MPDRQELTGALLRPLGPPRSQPDLVELGTQVADEVDVHHALEVGERVTDEVSPGIVST